MYIDVWSNQRTPLDVIGRPIYYEINFCKN